jgi:BlaI family transcriptional regulator, penicillinase repressor
MGRQQAEAVPAPTEAELEVLQALWRLGPSTVREVHQAIARTKPVGYTTVLKQMQVMQEKGLLTRSERFRAHVYEARAPRGQTQRQLVRSLLARVFDGSARELLQSALAGRRIDREELAEIRRLLDEIERGAR